MIGASGHPGGGRSTPVEAKRGLFDLGRLHPIGRRLGLGLSRRARRPAPVALETADTARDRYAWPES